MLDSPILLMERTKRKDFWHKNEKWAMKSGVLFPKYILEIDFNIGLEASCTLKMRACFDSHLAP